MNQNVHQRVYLLSGMNNGSGIMLPFTMSLVCHVALFAILIFGPGYSIGKKNDYSVISVRMVSLPAAPEAMSSPPAGKKDAEKPELQKAPEPVSAPVKSTATTLKPDNAVSLAPKSTKSKTSLKKKTYKPDKILESAIKQIEKAVDASEPDPLSKALGDLKDSVAKTEAEKAAASKTAAPAGAGTAMGSGDGGNRAFDQMDIYKNEILFHIQKNWAFSAQLAGSGEDIEAVLVIRILRDGEIRDVWFEKWSGNNYLDESAKKAVTKSNPLPPLPKSYTGREYTIGLIFGPEGIK
ncbi:MAG: TonB C-terminal domain-containing protein [Desulfobacterales bacterium]|nr:TonB C-terminal domain-containing protein [Desulfobacterales bacterium]